MKKTRATTKRSTSKPAKNKSGRSKKPKDLADARKTITELVRVNSHEMAAAVVDEGLKGKVAQVKYLFEATGIFPATSGTEEPPEKESLARKLLDHMGFSANPSESGEATKSGAPEPTASNGKGREGVSQVENEDGETESPEADGEEE